jgi:predicted ferric reductase
VNLAVRALAVATGYVVLALAPLLVAVAADPYAAPRPWAADASVALGFLAFPLLLAQFALVSRLGPASRPFGSDALMAVHRQMAVVALVFVIVHAAISGRLDWRLWNPFTGSPAAAWGATALWGLVLIVITSFARKRLRLRYEAWQILHLGLGVLIAGAGLAHMLALRGYSSTLAVRWTLLLYAALFLVLLLRYRIVRPLLLRRRPWTIAANDDVGGRSRLLRVRPVGHAGFRFEPGQFAWLVTGRSPLFSQQHPLSMASPPEAPDGELEFLIKAAGDWSGTVVPRLQAGDRVWVDGPFGAFTPEWMPAQGFVLLAGGIGIAPLRSMLRSMLARGDRREVVLFYAAADRQRAVMAADLESLRESLALTIVFVFEEADADWTGERGRLTPAVIRRHLPHSYLRFQYFVCGPLPMIDAVEAMLDGIGIPASRVHTERFEMV